MVFKRLTLPKSIYDNVGYGVKLHFKPTREELDNIVERVSKGLHYGKKWQTDNMSLVLHYPEVSSKIVYCSDYRN